MEDGHKRCDGGVLGDVCDVRKLILPRPELLLNYDRSKSAKIPNLPLEAAKAPGNGPGE